MNRSPYNPNPETVRFWLLWKDSPVKVALRDGQKINFHHAYNHEEGWSEEWQEIRRDGAWLFLDSGTDGRDCDGRLSHVMAHSANIFRDLRHSAPQDWIYEYIDGHGFRRVVDWQEVTHRVFDEYAEAANY
tara:strand:+ start:2755 stop:3147 length:393 start_codon:yes stop_codon:yes gene_type:complete